MWGAGLSLERWKIAKAECVPVHEGSTCVIVTRDDVASPGSKAGSRMNSIRRNMRGPTGSAELVSGGDGGEALPEPPSELRSGVGLAHSTDDAVEGNEMRRGKGPARKEPRREGWGPDAERGRPASQPRPGERGGPFGRPDPVHRPVASRGRRRARTGVPAAEAAGECGSDGITVADYERNLAANLQDLCARVHTARYRPQPVRRVHIPKTDGGQRPLGVPTLEDKIVQGAVAEVLSAIYEVDFLGFYGFRPGRNPHQALSALHTAIMSQHVNWVLDADNPQLLRLGGHHEWLLRMLAHRIADPRVLRLVRMWLEAGILESGERHETERGTPQGRASFRSWPTSSCITPSISGSINGDAGMLAVGSRSSAMPTTS